MKKSKTIVALLIALIMVMTVVLTACQHSHTYNMEVWLSDATNHWHNATCEHTDEVTDLVPHDWGTDDRCVVCGRSKSDVGLVYSEPLMSIADYRAYVITDLTADKALFGELKATEVTAAYDAGVAAINSATSIGGVKKAYDEAKLAMLKCIPLADGVQDFSGLSATDKTEILGLMEAYAIRSGLTGITMFENGGYAIYSDRITFGTEEYIPGFGFGNLMYGELTKPLAGETNADWKMYYHSALSQDPGTANYLNAQDSLVSDIYSYFGASYYDVFMNETRNGYYWDGVLAIGMPIPVGGLDDYDQAATWKIQLRKDLQYNTNSTIESRAAFDGREVALEDFLTPYKLLLNAQNGLFRGTEFVNQNGKDSIVGAKEYYNATQKLTAPEGESYKGILDESVYSFDDTVKIRVYKENEGQDNETWWMEYTLGGKTTEFYAMTALASSLYMPIPKDFIDLVTIDYYLGFNDDDNTTPVDNSLSLGAYTLEQWDFEQQIVYKRNPYYNDGIAPYKIAGVHINILLALQSDANAAFNEFLIDKLDACSIPEDYLEEYVSDSRTKKTTGSSTFKLNMNALDQETWESMFGVNGTISQTPVNEYWQTEPALANSHFRTALSYAFDRNSFAAAKGSVASLNFFSSAYMADPVNNIAYNLTQAHKDAVGILTNKLTDDGGYSLALAREYFRLALAELEATGGYVRGTKDNPTVISIEIAWFTAAYEEAYHKYAKQYWETAFNDDSVHGGCYKLDIKFWSSPKNDANDTYDRILGGTFDIGFGSISGGLLDPLNFMSVLSADQVLSSGFTLNWAVDTNDPYAGILIYNDMLWSYDALYMSSQQPSIIVDGKLQHSMEVEATIEEEGDTVTMTIVITWHTDVEPDWDLFDLDIYDDMNYDGFALSDLFGEDGIDVDEDLDEANNTYTIIITITDGIWDDIFAEDAGKICIDVYAAIAIPKAQVEAEYPAFQGTWFAK